VVRDGDLVVTMGAGNIGAIAHELPAQLTAALASVSTPARRRRRRGDPP
jgi:hypothetical protein